MFNGHDHTNPTDDVYATMWLAPGLGETNGIQLTRSTDSTEIQTLVITPPSGRTGFDLNGSIYKWNLYVDPVKTYGVRLLDSDNNTLHYNMLNVPKWSVNDVICHFGDYPVENVSKIKIWVEEVWDTDFSSDHSSYDPAQAEATKGSTNYGGITEVRAFIDDVLTGKFDNKIIGSGQATDESIRSPENGNNYDTGSYLDTSYPEPVSSNQMLVTIGTLEGNNTNPSKFHDLSLTTTVQATSQVQNGQDYMDYRNSRLAYESLIFTSNLLMGLIDLISLALLFIFDLGMVTKAAGEFLLKKVVEYSLKELVKAALREFLKGAIRAALRTAIKAATKVAGYGLVAAGVAIIATNIVQSMQLFGPLGPIVAIAGMGAAKYLAKPLAQAGKISKLTGTNAKLVANSIINSRKSYRIAATIAATAGKINKFMSKAGQSAGVAQIVLGRYAGINLPLNGWNVTANVIDSVFSTKLGAFETIDELAYTLINGILPGNGAFSAVGRIVSRAIWDNDLLLTEAILMPVKLPLYSSMGVPEYATYVYDNYSQDYAILESLLGGTGIQ